MRGITLIAALLLTQVVPSLADSSESYNIDLGQKQPIICTSDISSNDEMIVSSSLVSQGGDFFGGLLETSNWPARWYCGIWTPFHGWLYIISDVLIWLCYFAIPFVLVYFIWKRKTDLPFKSVLVLFVAFILACGVTHLVDAAIFWWPAYRLSAFVRFLTAAVSMSTVVALVKVIPQALTLKTSEQYQLEIDQRIKLQNQFKLFIKYTPGSTAIFDKEMKYIVASDQWLNDYALQAEEIIGRSHFEVFSGRKEMLYLGDHYKRAQNGETIKVQEERIVSRDGSVGWIKWELHPWFDTNEQIGGVIMSTEVITLKKELELKLKEQNAKLAKLNNIYEETSQKARIGSWEMDLQSQDLYWSPIVYAIHDLENGADVSLDQGINFYHPENRKSISDAIENCIQNQVPWNLELKIITAKNREVWVKANGGAVVDNGKIVKLRGHFQDIDDKKRVEIELQNTNQYLEQIVEKRTEQLTEANSELEAFSYSVSHDLRAPLRSINGNAQIIIEDHRHQLDEDASDCLDTIVRNSVKMGALIDDLLNLSRTGRTELVLVPSSMNEMVEKIIAESEFEKGQNIEWKISPLLNAPCDARLMAQVWENLISNAVKYSSKNDMIVIEIDSQKNDDQVIYSVKDNGVGFDEKYSDKLYGVFQRLHSLDEFEGTGVGLALVRRIVTRHGGKEWAESKLGVGSTFYFTLTG
ncbi:ATP-binding protein [uncultured Imperialibacter sp.]|uniref:PAS domain-containing sensor histidine kinase n=1 Tax=uncultured Imperialibacter sp. TaxID=1672639 RepID=UPI0030D7B690|tara:strand:- start:2485 stop:4572 length:2088 start_codon:yes stop_codon:yes gene_type:complete